MDAGKPHIRLKADAFSPFSPRHGFNTAHHGASRTLPDVADWHASRGSADADLLYDLPELQYRARDIRRNNGFAQSVGQTGVDHIVGSGLRLCAQPDYIALGKTKDWADEWGAKYESQFHEWWWSTACHAGDTKTGDMLTEEVMYAKFDNGGSLTLPLWIPDRGDGYATKLQTVEIDRLSNPNGAPNTTQMRGGIEFDDFGMPLFYNIRKAHPGDTFLIQSQLQALIWERIPRRTPFGRLRVIHDFEGDRADQTRGKPLLSAVLDQFKNIDRYVKAEIQAALMNAMIWGAITTPLEHEQIEALFRGDEEKYLEHRRVHATRMKAGTLATLFPGDKLEPFMPTRPAAQFGVFVENIEKIISVGAGIPHVLVKKDFSQSNYSNTRAAMIEAWLTFNRRRDRLGAGWLDPINDLFMEERANAGAIDLTPAEFYAHRRAYLRCTWIGPGMGYLDKTKEATGDMLMLDSNTTTLQKVCAMNGMHWREVLDQRATERAYADKLGLPSVAPTRVTVTSAETPEENNGAPEQSGKPPPPKKGASERIEVELAA